MSDPNSSSLICGCSKYICETAGNRLNQDSNHLRPSHGLTDNFFVDGLLLPFILEGIEVVTEFHVLDYIRDVIPDSVMPAVEKQLLQEISPSTITDLKNECEQILEAIRLLTDVADTQHMRNELTNDSLHRRLAHIDQIDKAQAHWKSQEFKVTLLQASQGLRVCWYSQQGKAQHTAIDVSRKLEGCILARDVNSRASDISTSTRTMASSSASAGRDRCSLSFALRKAETGWGKNASQAKKALSRRVNKSVEQPAEISSSSPPLTVDIPDRSIAGNMKTDQSHLGMLV